MTTEDDFKTKGHCCSCFKSLKNMVELNLIDTGKRVPYHLPYMGNIIIQAPWNTGTAVLCDSCVKENKPPRYVVEFSEGNFYYHKVEDYPDAFNFGNEPEYLAFAEDIRKGWEAGPESLRQAVRKFSDEGSQMTDQEVDLVRWYLFRYVGEGQLQEQLKVVLPRKALLTLALEIQSTLAINPI